MFRRRAATGWLIAYLVAAALNVAGTFLHSPELSGVTKPVLMPLLLAFFISRLDGLQHHLATWVKRALVFSWLGELALLGDGDLWFVLGIAGFLAAQVCYIIGFRPFAALGPLRERPWLAIPYIAAGLSLFLVLVPDLGGLTIPVAIYAASLVAMAVLATGVSPMTAAGAVLFLASDSILALTELSDRLPEAAGAWVMPTYLAGQLLIVLGVLQNLGRASGVHDFEARAAV